MNFTAWGTMKKTGSLASAWSWRFLRPGAADAVILTTIALIAVTGVVSNRTAITRLRRRSILRATLAGIFGLFRTLSQLLGSVESFQAGELPTLGFID